MIARLRHAFPILQTLSNGGGAGGGWLASTSALQLVRPLARAGTRAAAADSDGLSIEPSAPSLSDPPPPADEPKRRRRSTTGSKAKSKAVAEVDPAAAAGLEPGTTAGAGADAAEGTSAPSAAKRRAPSRRKAATAAAAAAGDVTPASGGDEQAAAGGEAAAALDAPAKRRSRKKQAEEAPAGEAEAVAPPGGTAAEEAAAGAKKGGAKRATKKAAAAVAAADDVTPEEVENIIEKLPYEDFLILPRKAEQVLIAMGKRAPLSAAGDAVHPPGGAAAAAAASNGAPPHGGPVGRQLSDVGEIAEFLQWRQPRDVACPLLMARYQGYLGASDDLLFDLFHMDFEGPFLASEAVSRAAVEAAKSARSLLSATGMPPDPLLRAAMERLTGSVGQAAVMAQEGAAPQLTEAQLTLFLLDWASACLAGPKRGDDDAVGFAARRCAALQLSKPSVQERLLRYVVQGAGLEELAVTAGRSGTRAVRLTQPMDALLEGLKAGVKLDRGRLLADFRLGSPDDPLQPHLPELFRRIELQAVASPEPGSKAFYDSLVGKLMLVPPLAAAIRKQERLWETEQGDRDGSALTVMQLRLLYHLWRRDRFSAERPLV
ncbi:hypothetical protein GPECTOR_35g913 [Gonium pectorale]|uniref:Uncharacterized protein n=1 Tax=Gonium pectorale TaxID=33097 RepID=A0A150GD17_GONPE|nr:hypothetical protein GPECTOR_35g913 [Gonium pectorale]|eukprot:KXZ47475.1 hypothetical protein GPECTOR_35g913 [Gonium pectorale]